MKESGEESNYPADDEDDQSVYKATPPLSRTSKTGRKSSKERDEAELKFMSNISNTISSVADMVS